MENIEQIAAKLRKVERDMAESEREAARGAAMQAEIQKKGKRWDMADMLFVWFLWLVGVLLFAFIIVAMVVSVGVYSIPLIALSGILGLCVSVHME